jgi:uncharacterized membrane protein
VAGKTNTLKAAAGGVVEVEQDLAAHNRNWLDRLTFLTDGVFAIAVTLLSVEIREPPGWRTLPELWAGLEPQLGIYAVSFVVIASYWLAHRRIMSTITKVDAPLTVLTLFTLGLVALVPGLTHLHFPSAAILVYGALVISIGASLAAIYAYAGLIRDYVSPQVSRRQRWFQIALWIFTPAFLLGVIWVTALPLLLQAPLMVALFMIGWPMRMWVLKRLADKPAPIATRARTKARGAS